MPTNAELAKVHIAKRDLKLTDTLYRGFLNVLFGRSSAKDLTHEQVEELLEHFKLIVVFAIRHQTCKHTIIPSSDLECPEKSHKIIL